MKKYSLPHKIEKWIQAQLFEMNLSFESKENLSQAIKKMSDFYVTQPQAETPWNESWCKVAQLVYYFPLNYLRNLRVAQEFFKHPVINQFFNENYNQSEVEINWLELGCGLGPSLEAFIEELEKHFPFISVKKSLKVSFIEKSQWAFELTKKRLSEYYDLSVGETNLQSASLNSKLKKDFLGFDIHKQTIDNFSKNNSLTIAVLSYSLTELDMLPNWIWNTDFILILEPSTRDDGRNLMNLREKALNNNYLIIAPCTHQKACPLLNESKKDWCHDRIHFDQPDWFTQIEEKLPFKNSNLTLSYLILAHPRLKNQLSLKQTDSTIRVVGDFLEEKGKTRQLICRGPQREFLTFIKKNHEPTKFNRGDILTLKCEPEKKGEELRPHPTDINIY